MSMLSAIILTKNEEEMLEDCLKSVAFAGEIIVVDSGSTDKTVVIAKKHKAKIVEDLSGDFSKKRNVGSAMAEGDWILYVDADERVSPELAASVKEITESKDARGSYYLTRQNFYLGTAWPGKERFLRLFKKEALVGWEGELHETAKVRGESGDLPGDLLHYTHRDLKSMLDKTIKWSEIEADLRYKASHPKMTWWRFPRVMLQAFIRSYIQQKGYKVGTAGITESLYQSFSAFVTYARLWELQQKEKE